MLLEWYIHAPKNVFRAFPTCCIITISDLKKVQLVGTQSCRRCRTVLEEKGERVLGRVLDSTSSLGCPTLTTLLRIRAARAYKLTVLWMVITQPGRELEYAQHIAPIDQSRRSRRAVWLWTSTM